MIRVSALALLALIAAAGTTAPAVAKSGIHPSQATAHQTRRLFDVAPQNSPAVNPDDPSLTGGGSLGYNQMIYNS